MFVVSPSENGRVVYPMSLSQNYKKKVSSVSCEQIRVAFFFTPHGFAQDLRPSLLTVSPSENGRVVYFDNKKTIIPIMMPFITVDKIIFEIFFFSSDISISCIDSQKDER